MNATRPFVRIPFLLALLLSTWGIGAAAQGGVDLSDLVASNDLRAIDACLTREGTNLLNAARPDGVTPLHLAAALNHRDVAVLLLARGAAVNARTEGGFTALHWAASRDAEDTAKVLIEFGADLNAATAQGITPLHWAASNNATNVVKLLITKGARIDAATGNGHTPLHWAVMRGASDTAIQLAFKAVSNQMDSETSAVPAEVSAADAAGGDRPSAPPAPDKDGVGEENANAAVPGSGLAISLAQDEPLEFVWIEALGMWFGKYEITNGQFRRFDPGHASAPHDKQPLDGENQPAVYVSWHKAKAFCEWLNGAFAHRIPKGWEFRLPTSAQWIAAAKCGTERKYPWGDEWPPKYGNYGDRSAKEALPDSGDIAGYEDGFPVTCPVDKSGSNELGVFGLAGNAWEWCEDWYGTTRRYKVRHGAAWDCGKEAALRIETQGFDRPDAAYETVGFRVVVARKEPPVIPAASRP